MPKVSIVVPVCNVEKYVAKCLDSIIRQTLTDIEIICVDDGSTDNSGRILDAYAQKDSRIQVIHKENSGYGDSMNIGFSMAKGEYIGIVESDDAIKPEMYQVLYENAKEHDLDLIKSNAFFWWEPLHLWDSSYSKDLEDFYDVVLTPKNRESMFLFFMNTWTGIYKREFIERYHIRHNTTPGASYQDNGFWVQTLCFCERAMWLKEAYYYYRQDNPTASVKSKNKVYAMRNEYEYVLKVLENRVSEAEMNLCFYYRMMRHRGTFNRIDDSLKREFCNTIIDEYGRYKKYILHNEDLNNWFEQICSNPDEVCRQIIEKRSALMSVFENTDRVVIYGAGHRAKTTIKLLYNMGVWNKVSAIVVTKKNAEEKLAEMPVLTFDEFEEYDKKTVFIIAVSEKTDAYQSILGELEKRGIKNYISSANLFQ